MHSKVLGQTNTLTNIGIAGAGAVGFSIAAMLQKTLGKNARLFAIDPRPEAVTEKIANVVLHSEKAAHQSTVRLPLAGDNIKLGLIFVALKSTQIDNNIIEAIKTNADQDATVVSLCNGMKTQAGTRPLLNLQPLNTLSQSLAQNGIDTTSAVVAFPANRSITTNDGLPLISTRLRQPVLSIRETYNNKLSSTRLAQIAEAMSAQGYDVRLLSPNDFTKCSLEKLALNLSNLMAASLGINCGEIISNDVFNNGFRLMLEEFYEFYAAEVAHPTDKHLFIENLMATVKTGGNHRTSTGQDIESGRATEKDTMFAALIEAAARKQIAMPVIEFAYQLLSAREKQCCESPRFAANQSFEDLLNETANNNQKEFLTFLSANTESTQKFEPREKLSQAS